MERKKKDKVLPEEGLMAVRFAKHTNDTHLGTHTQQYTVYTDKVR